MILTRKIVVVVENSEKYGFEKEKEYPVIGTRPRYYVDKQDSNKTKMDYQFLVINREGRAVGVFPSHCKVRIID